MYIYIRAQLGGMEIFKSLPMPKPFCNKLLELHFATLPPMGKFCQHKRSCDLPPYISEALRVEFNVLGSALASNVCSFI